MGSEWYRIDLIFFHRRLRALILIDLKLGKFTHADAGQMNLYLNYAREYWTYEGENQPIGLILCSERNEAVAHYALGNLSNAVLAREYKIQLPSEERLADELEETRRAILTRAASRHSWANSRDRNQPALAHYLAWLDHHQTPLRIHNVAGKSRSWTRERGQTSASRFA